ncbi:GntR family transcriptional regulator [Saccharibacillus kuerlensis]|uniref:GntR family transcriptional regulator n=1 Tax=Saccharibacillus kuerlensis TaxID=459527 RepID=A0ABQ2L604_9BACL|nr:GntR family transcriptional regulator [Saccharibacillus kuerlensis]GGO04669.1 GntR family transcriptional regulator [Saccharibacillus kuerlensis]
MPIPTGFTTPNRLSAKQRAFQQLQEWIIDGTLQPGEKLNDGELANALGVSRTPVREALQLLSVEGLVEMNPGVSTQVTGLNGEDITKILPPLAALQSLAAEIALPLINTQTIESLRHINAEFGEALAKDDYHYALKLDEEFHGIIVELTENPYIANTISTFQAHVRRLFFHNSIILDQGSVDEHEEIVQAFERGDRESLNSLVRHNWLRAVDAYQAKMQRNPE